jgi:hypothetical protein
MTRRSLLRNLLDAGAVVTALIFIESYFPLRHGSVMLEPTTTNGGDMGTHYYPAWFLRYVLLPHWQVIGWCPGNYGGYPLFQFYFPLPFVLMAALSKVVAFPVAFKLISVLGTFLLPVCAYACLRLAGVPFPGPALGALTPMFFIFMEANSMWGGNIPSTLAGEFSLSLGLALTILFFGSLQRAIDTGRGKSWNGLLVSMIGLSHGYTLLWAWPTSALQLVSTRQWWRRVWTLVAVHGLGVLLMGFFLIQLIGYGPWTTAYNHSWPIRDWKEVLPPILWPAAGVATVASLVVGVIAFFRRTPYPRPLGTLWGAMAIAVLFWLTAHSFHVVDIRFWPFVQLGLCLTAAAALGYVLALLPVPEIWPAVGALAILPYVQARVTFIPSWIHWNYSGFEAKTTWPVFKKVNDHLHGDFRSPRVVYEHSAENESLGTVRAFEDLPLFSGRNTLEGLYMQSSPSAPFVFFIQSEISKDQSCPFPNYGCSRLDLDRGIAHLRMFNVSHFVARSQPVKTAIAGRTDIEKETTIGPFDIYRLKDNADRYAIPLTLAPVLVRTPDWKATAYRWFKRAGPDDPTPVFVERVDDVDRAAFAAVVDDANDLPRKPVDSVPALAEEMPAPDRIVVTGAKPGHPILIRISYHPRWRALTGERIWLAGPSFMLVVPKGERVELVFDGGGWVTLAHLFSTVGVLLFLIGLVPLGGRVAVGARGLVPEPVMALVRRGEAWSTHTRRTVLAGGVAVCAVVFAILTFVKYVPNGEAVYRAGQKLYDAGRLEEAAPYFRTAQQMIPLSATAIHATYYEAIIAFRLDHWDDAEKTFTRLLDTFPEAPNAPEALYHIGLCRLHRGDVAGARQAWEQTQQRFPSAPWAKYAGDRLAEVNAQHPPAGG